MTALASKFRVYDCPGCGAHPCRPLTGEPKPCDVCGASLVGLSHRVEDYHLYAETILKVARGEHPPDGYFPDPEPGKE